MDYSDFSDYPNDIISVSHARTNKLHCGECKRKISIGEQVVFYLDPRRGRRAMKDCICSSCGQEIIDAELEAQAFSDAIGIGQD